jgi:phage-related holin
MVLTLIIIDLVTALAAEYKVGHAIESRKALKTVTKIVIYGLMVAGAHLTEEILPGTTFLDSAAISFLALTELISILENIGKAGYAIPKKLLNQLETLREKE